LENQSKHHEYFRAVDIVLYETN